MHAVVTRENVSERKRASAAGRFRHTKASRIAAIAQADAPNRLLAALPAKEYERLLAGFEPVKLTYGEVLYEPGEQMRHVYFPSDCVVSLLTVVEGHRALEVGLVGREGMVGSRLALGITTASVRALVQGTGTAVRIKSARFLREFHHSPALQRALLHFTDTLMNQVTQTAACNRFHLVEARLARLLLMTHERLPSGEFHLTQEFHCGHVGCATGGRDGGCQRAATPETDPLPTRHHRDSRSAGSRSLFLFLLPTRQDHGARSRGLSGVDLRLYRILSPVVRNRTCVDSFARPSVSIQRATMRSTVQRNFQHRCSLRGEGVGSGAGQRSSLRPAGLADIATGGSMSDVTERIRVARGTRE